MDLFFSFCAIFPLGSNAISEKRSLATRRDATHTHTFALVGYATSIKIRRRRVCADDDGGAQGAQDVPAAVVDGAARHHPTNCTEPEI